MSPNPSMPFDARTRATSPRSEHTLYARSTRGRSAFVANAAARASTIVMSAMPSRIWPTTIRTTYFASLGVALPRRSDRRRIFRDRKSTRLNSSHLVISYAVFCLKKKKHEHTTHVLVVNFQDLLQRCIQLLS